MQSRTIHFLIIGLILFVGYLSPVSAATVTDAEMEALEKQIEQKEVEQKKQAEVEARKQAEAEAAAAKQKRLLELEKQRQEEQKKLEEEKRKLEEEKRKLEQARQEEEARRAALEEQKRKEEEAANARVTVVFFRKTGFLGGGFAVTISNNGTALGSLPNGSFFIHESPVGKQTFSTDKAFTSYGFSTSFEFAPGKVYYIQLLVGAEEGLKLVSANEGREYIKNLKNTGSMDPADILIN